jgi:muconolactone D-isomerase
VQFLVDIRVRLPEGLGDESRTALVAAELARGRELRAAGLIEQIWRVAGARRNVGIWRAKDGDALHEAIASLPLFDWMSVRVTALAVHPIEQESDRA